MLQTCTNGETKACFEVFLCLELPNTTPGSGLETITTVKEINYKPALFLLSFENECEHICHCITHFFSLVLQ